MRGFPVCGQMEAAVPQTPLLNEERRRAILDVLNHHGRVLVTELARQFE